MKIAIIGATGHIGTSLVPRLVQEGHHVLSVSRARRMPYRDPGIWRFVERIECDREAEEAAGTFGKKIAALKADVVIDLICFTRQSAEHLVSHLVNAVGHYVCCGTIWVHGHSEVVPTTEAMPRRPFGDYGIRKAEMESWLLGKARSSGFPATILHPGHIVGIGWVPLNPAGNFNVGVFKTLAEGRPLALPNLGMETVHHVHADDVAQAFCRALEHPGAAAGESFHVVSPAAVTLRGFAERTARWFGHDAALSYLPWDEWRKAVPAADAAATGDHIAHSPSCSIEKARRLIGYEPRYGSLDAVFEAIGWLAERGWSVS